MFQNKLNIGITFVFLMCIGSVAVLLKNVSVKQSSTLEQMLPVKYRTQINHYRQIFNIESEPVIIAIQSPVAVTADRISEIEIALRSVNNVSNTLSSVSIKHSGFSNKQLLSLQNNTELILLMIKPGAQQLETSKKLSDRIRQTVNSHLKTDESLLIAGQPQIRAASWNITSQDLKIILPLLVVITIVISLLFFNSYTALALSLLLTSLTTVICLGLHLLIRTDIDILLVLAIPVIWAISTLDAFHLYNRTAIKVQENNLNPAKAAGKELFIPCLLTTVTTAGCFLTLTVQDTSPLIITFGLWCAAGAVIAFILTFTLGEQLLGEKLLSLDAIKKSSALWPGEISFKFVKLAQKHYLLTLIFWGALALLSLFYVSQLRVSMSYPQIFTSSKNIAQEIEQLRDLTGSDLNAVDIIVEASDSDGKTVSNIANAILLTSNYLNTIDETRLVLPIDLLNQSDMKKVFKQWQSDGSVHKNTASYDASSLRNWFNEETYTARLQLYMAQTSYERKQEIFNWIVHFDETMLSHHNIILSGSGYFYNLTEKQGLKSLVSSSVLSLIILVCTLFWITGNRTRVLIALSGSIIPALIVTGFMAKFNIPWSIAMLPLPAVLLGLMNDDTIHIIWSSRKSRQFDKLHFRRNALKAGAALLATTLVLSCAVATLTLSGIQTNQYLGVLIPLGLLLAYLCNLSLIPALNSLLHKSAQSTY